MKQGTKILTLNNGYHLWSHTDGEDSQIHLLALHGGPGGNHEYWENFHDELKKQGLNVQVHYYDQLGSWYSDQPDYSDPKIAAKYLTYDYFLDEVEEVRQKLGIDHFYLIGQSWGGALTMLYALKYGSHLKGAIISSMVDNIDEYLEHQDAIRDESLSPKDAQFMRDCEKNGDWHNERYQELVEVLNEGYVDRKQPPAISHLVDTMAVPVYNAFQGDNEFVVTRKLKEWDIRDQIHKIKVPTLLTFGEHETMPLKSAQRMAQAIPNSRLVTTPNGGHHHMIDNAPVYFKHLADYLRDVESGKF
ncbi:proline-specific peptidase family protein [Pediococcus inopinatus]|uniref:proline-specific peptidase family protein n=1 Tax=Pediococcus inopinatus TaxID=114090 RepID=UPI002B261B6D|nr:proline-specific peptidase family protein [Pediococcus inopinatus]WPC17189.1 proline-specific peptidase family protein [Pediococcus inopinatus]